MFMNWIYSVLNVRPPPFKSKLFQQIKPTPDYYSAISSLLKRPHLSNQAGYGSALVDLHTYSKTIPIYITTTRMMRCSHLSNQLITEYYYVFSYVLVYLTLKFVIFRWAPPLYVLLCVCVRLSFCPSHFSDSHCLYPTPIICSSIKLYITCPSPPLIYL